MSQFSSLRLILVGFWVIILVSGISLSQGQSPELKTKADEARMAGQSEDAISLYREILKSDRNWTEGWWFLGILSYETGEFEEARRAFRVVTALDPESGVAWVMTGLCQVRLRKYYLALESINRGLTLGDGIDEELRYTAHFRKATLLNRMEEHETAFNTLWLLLRNHSEDPRLKAAVGACSLRLPFLLHELPLSLRDAVVLTGQAVTFGAMEEVDKAHEAFTELIARYPSMRNVHYVYGQFLRVRNDPRALEMFQKELEISPSHVPARLQIAYQHLSAGQPEKALPVVQEALRIESDSAAVRYILGQVYLDLDQTEKAIEELEKAVGDFPNSARIHTFLGRAYFRAGRTDEARREMAEAERIRSLQMELERGMISGSTERTPD
jgi:tetratricopeptide (TPR) repeat protein